jgi:type IV pilus assembly protein PilC
MSEIGELSGNLDSVMTNLSDFYQRDAELRRRVRSALIYPLVLLVMMAAVIVLLIARVLPVFNEILSAFGASMPPVSLALMNAGLFIGRNIWWLVPLAIFLIVIVMIWVRKGRGRVWLEKFKTMRRLLAAYINRFMPHASLWLCLI